MQVTSTLAAILTRKVRLQIQNPLQRHAILTTAEHEMLFEVAIETIELTYKLRTDPRIQKWHWFFSSYNQWHALAYTIFCLCVQPLGKKANRAWRAVEETVVLRWNDMSAGIRREAHQWRHIMRMLDQAKSRKRQAVRRLRDQQKYTNQAPDSTVRPSATEGQPGQPNNQDALGGLGNNALDVGGQSSIDEQFHFGSLSPFLDFQGSRFEPGQFGVSREPDQGTRPSDIMDFDFDAILGSGYEV